MKTIDLHCTTTTTQQPQQLVYLPKTECILASCSEDKCKLADNNFNSAIAVVNGDWVFKLEIPFSLMKPLRLSILKVLRNLFCIELISACSSQTC